MTTTHSLDQNIQFLISANYQRMLSYEQAAFLTSEKSFKEFYIARADESEANIHQLQMLLNINQSVDAYNEQADAKFANLLHGKKSTIKILESVKTIENTIVKWYKNTLQEIKDLPKEIINLVESQYNALSHAQLELGHL